MNFGFGKVPSYITWLWMKKNPTKYERALRKFMYSKWVDASIKQGLKFLKIR